MAISNPIYKAILTISGNLNIVLYLIQSTKKLCMHWRKHRLYLKPIRLKIGRMLETLLQFLWLFVRCPLSPKHGIVSGEVCLG